MKKINATMVLHYNGVSEMAVKRIVSEKIAEEKTYEKARKMADMLPAGPILAQYTIIMNEMKARIAARP